jgi:hypothetical protein
VSYKIWGIGISGILALFGPFSTFSENLKFLTRLQLPKNAEKHENSHALIWNNDFNAYQIRESLKMGVPRCSGALDKNGGRYIGLF